MFTVKDETGKVVWVGTKRKEYEEQAAKWKGMIYDEKTNSIKPVTLPPTT